MSPFDFYRTEYCFLIYSDLVGKIAVQRKEMTDRSVSRSSFIDVIVRTYDHYSDTDFVPVGKFLKVHLWLTNISMRALDSKTRIGATRNEKSIALNGILSDYFEKWNSFEAYLKTIENEEFNIPPMETTYEKLMQQHRELQQQCRAERKCYTIAWEV